MKVEDVMRCNFASWYDRFFDLTMESIILPLPDVFVDYLNADSVVLPEGSHQGVYSSSVPGDGEDWDEEKVDWNSGEDCLEAKMPDCDYFLKTVDEAIERLGGRVFPKLNWSAPQDASWVSLNNSLECRHASDICLLLKSSNFISRDLTQPFIHCEDADTKCNDSVLQPDLVLKKWADINTGHEFRCFVYQGKLVGICPRNHSKYFQHIVEHRRQIQDEIVELFQETVDGEFTSEPSASYTFDVWRKERDDLWIIDFNPFGAVTDPLLFDWEEMPLLAQSEGPVLRCVESEAGVQPSQLAQFGVPVDFTDLSTGQDPFKLIDLLKLGGNQGQDSSSSEDDDDDDQKEKEAGLDTTDR